MHLDDRFAELRFGALDALEQRALSIVEQAGSDVVHLGPVLVLPEHVARVEVRLIVALAMADREDELAAAIEVRPSGGPKVHALQERQDVGEPLLR